MKPMMLLAVVILLVFLVQSLYSGLGKEKLAQKNLDIVSTGTNILLILASSEQCLAYESPVTEKSQGNILDIEKLDVFDSDYHLIEPECARNYDFGWRVNVEQFERQGTNTIVTREWDFGSQQFSTGESLNNEISLWIPVAIKYPEGHVECLEGCTKLGKMHMRLVDGELENLAGFFDWSCRMGQLDRAESLSTEVKISRDIIYDQNTNQLCIGNSCRLLSCELSYFDGISSEGIHELTVNYQDPDILLVG